MSNPASAGLSSPSPLHPRSRLGLPSAIRCTVAAHAVEIWPPTPPRQVPAAPSLATASACQRGQPHPQLQATISFDFLNDVLRPQSCDELTIIHGLEGKRPSNPSARFAPPGATPGSRGRRGAEMRRGPPVTVAQAPATSLRKVAGERHALCKFFRFFPRPGRSQNCASHGPRQPPFGLLAVNKLFATPTQFGETLLTSKRHPSTGGAPSSLV